MTISVLSAIINEPKRGIGPGTVDKIREFAQMQESSLLDASANIMLSGIKGKAAQAIWDFANLILDLREKLDQMTITELVEEVLDKTGYMTALTNQGKFGKSGPHREYPRVPICYQEF